MSQLDCALDLMRRLPPAQIEENLAGLLDLAPDLTEDLLSAVDQVCSVILSLLKMGIVYLLLFFVALEDCIRSSL